MTGLSSLVGARIRRIDAPEPSLLALTLFGPELRAVMLMRAAGERAGVGLVDSRPHGQPASSFVQKLRKELENARIAGFEQPAPSALALVLARGELSTTLVCDFAAGAFALERDGRPLIRSPTCKGQNRRAHTVEWPSTVEALHCLGERLIADQAEASFDAQRHALSRLVQAARKRLQRRMQAVEQDRARAAQAQTLRARANLLLAQQHLVRRGQRAVTLTDYSVDPPGQVEIALDPARSVQEQIEGWFKQAKRFERGAVLAAQRSAATAREIAQLDALASQLAGATPEQLAELAEQARSLGLAGVGRALDAELGQATGKKAPRPTRTPYKRFAGWKDRIILVGKTAADNDALTREHARPQDLWLHARGCAGAHVVVPLARNEVCPAELLLDAAHLAAHFSAARSEPTVDISYTGKRYVRKPRGAAPGQVTLEREKVLALQVEPARLTRLLSRERSE